MKPSLGPTQNLLCCTNLNVSLKQQILGIHFRLRKLILRTRFKPQCIAVKKLTRMCRLMSLTRLDSSTGYDEHSSTLPFIKNKIILCVREHMPNAQEMWRRLRLECEGALNWELSDGPTRSYILGALGDTSWKFSKVPPILPISMSYQVFIRSIFVKIIWFLTRPCRSRLP